MRTLQELTNKESGFIEYSDGESWVVTWTNIQGIPRQFAIGGIVGLGEDLSGAEPIPTPQEHIDAMRYFEEDNHSDPDPLSPEGFYSWRVCDCVVTVHDGWI
jgi:hypothetical protein